MQSRPGAYEITSVSASLPRWGGIGSAGLRGSLSILAGALKSPWCSGADPSAARKLYRDKRKFACFASGWQFRKVEWIISCTSSVADTASDTAFEKSKFFVYLSFRCRSLLNVLLQRRLNSVFLRPMLP